MQAGVVVGILLTCGFVMMHVRQSSLDHHDLDLAAEQVRSLSAEAGFASTVLRARASLRRVAREHLRQIAVKAADVTDELAQRTAPPALEGERSRRIDEARSLSQDLRRRIEAGD